uniref:Uncharacterized protein n=1 Tax=Oryza rufipogon TaxID=4529 RepID=A0A0E0PMW3_ORYRU
MKAESACGPHMASGRATDEWGRSRHAARGVRRPGRQRRRPRCRRLLLRLFPAAERSRWRWFPPPRAAGLDAGDADGGGATSRHAAAVDDPHAAADNAAEAAGDRVRRRAGPGLELECNERQFVPASCRSSSQRRRRHGPPASPPPPSRRQRWGEGGGGAVNDTQDDVVKKECDKRQPRQEMAVDAASQNGRTVACSSEASWTSRSGLLSGHA